MPVWDFKCSTCGLVLVDQVLHSYDVGVVCPKCGIEMKRQFPTGVQIDVFPEEGVHLEHVSAEGHTFHSKAEMRRYEKEHKVQLGYLGHA